jgi:hypothetical protein
MGASNVLAAYRLYAGKIPPTSLNVLAYMSLVSLDKDADPSWWEGHEMIAIRCFGRPEPVTKADLRAVERAITPLFRAGAITTIRHASGHRGRTVTVRYKLWLSQPAPDEKRRKPTVGTRRNMVQHPTIFGAAPDEKRRTKEEEEKEERDLTEVQVAALNVERAPAREQPVGNPDIDHSNGTGYSGKHRTMAGCQAAGNCPSCWTQLSGRTECPSKQRPAACPLVATP